MFYKRKEFYFIICSPHNSIYEFDQIIQAHSLCTFQASQSANCIIWLPHHSSTLKKSSMPNSLHVTVNNRAHSASSLEARCVRIIVQLLTYEPPLPSRCGAITACRMERAPCEALLKKMRLNQGTYVVIECEKSPVSTMPGCTECVWMRSSRRALSSVCRCLVKRTWASLLWL